MPPKQKDDYDERIRALELTNAAREERDKSIDAALRRIEGILTNGLATQVRDIATWMNAEIEAKKKQEAQAEQQGNRIWEIAKPFLVNAISVVVTVVMLIVALHIPNIAALFGLKVGP